RGPADDDQLLLGPDLDLEPGRAPPSRLVDRIARLGHDALEAADPGGLEERGALAEHVVAVADAWIVAEDGLEAGLALLEGQAEQALSGEPQQVEHLVDDAGALGSDATPPDLAL